MVELVINKMEMLPSKNSNDELKRAQVLRNIKEILDKIYAEILLISLLSFFIARATIMDDLTPFGVAFLSAYLVKYGSSLSMPIFISFGILNIHGANCVQYIIPVWFIFFSYKAMQSKLDKSTLKMSIFTCISFILLKSMYILVNDYYLYDILMTIFEGIIVFTLTYIFTYSIPTVKDKYSRVFTSEELICSAIMLALAISGLGSLSILGVSIKNIVGVFLVILFAYNKGASVGTVAGITIGLVTSMSQTNLPLVISVYGFSGLLAGLFKDIGKVGCCVGFVIGSMIMSFYIEGSIQTMLKLKEIVLAIILFILVSNIPKGLKSKIMIGVSKSNHVEEAYTSRLKDVTHNRLTEIAQVFEELGATFQRVSDKQRIVEQNDISRLVDTVVNDVCKNCAMCKFCWESDFYTTYHSMFDIMSLIELRGEITPDTLPENFIKRCIKTGLIASKCNYLFDMYKVDYKWESKIIESRQLVSQQLDGVSKIIKDLAEQIYSDVRFKQDVEKTIFAELRNIGLDIINVTVTEVEGDDFEIFIEMRTCTGNMQIDDIVSMVSDIIGVQLTHDKFKSATHTNESTLKFKLIKSNRFRAITKIAKADDGFNYISGDSYTFGERKNNYFVALSDGMGVGHKANQESDITISLLEKFLEAGFDKELALKTINSILVLKSTDEMLATIDMSIIDLYSGKSQFVKIGSAPTFIKRRNKVQIINAHSLPVGILKDVDFQVYEEKIDDGDFIITMSDGILDANIKADDKEKWMSDVIQSINSVNPQKIANKIVDTALESCDYKSKDDMTVLVTKVWRRR